MKKLLTALCVMSVASMSVLANDGVIVWNTDGVIVWDAVVSAFSGVIVW